jgi:DNA-binding beta-propeller fold protein YncE
MRKIQVRITIRFIAGLAALILFAVVPQLAQAQVLGALVQLASPNTCVETSTANGCPTTGATGLQGNGSVGNAVAVSPDGKNVYVLGAGDDAIAEFARSADGSLKQLASPKDCIAGASNEGSRPNGGATGLVEPVAIAISPDGKNVYVAAQDTHGIGTIAEFSRCHQWITEPARQRPRVHR